VGNEMFSNKNNLVQRVKSIIAKYPVTSYNDFLEIEIEDSNFMLEIFKFHPNNAEKLKNLKKILLGSLDISEKITKCFFIEKSDGSKDDISYLKSLGGLVNECF
jgi:hypothetical protein